MGTTFLLLSKIAHTIMKVALVFLAALAFAAAMPLAEFDLSPEEESLLEQIAADPSLVELFTDPVVVQVMTEMAADHIQKEATARTDKIASSSWACWPSRLVLPTPASAAKPLIGVRTINQLKIRIF